MTGYELLDIKAALEKASNWAHNQKDLFQMIAAKKLIEKELSEPSLPSDLDEAAEKHIRKVRDTPGWDWTTQDIAEAFKAGAEWMAKQGATLKVTDDTTWGEVNDFIHRNCDGAKEIQIRKK